jgi:hypothetical protein
MSAWSNAPRILATELGASIAKCLLSKMPIPSVAKRDIAARSSALGVDRLAGLTKSLSPNNSTHLCNAKDSWPLCIAKAVVALGYVLLSSQS